MAAIYSLHFVYLEDYWISKLIMWTDEHFYYELDAADFTFLCLWIITSLVLRIVERVYLLWALALKTAAKGDEGSAIYIFLGFALGHKLRESTDRLLSEKGEDGVTKWFDNRLSKFELSFVGLFCDEESFLKLRRRNRKARHLKKNQMSFHKDMVCFIFSLVVSLVVKFIIDGYYGLEYIAVDECVANHGSCIDEEDNNLCWCGTNLVYHVPTFIVIALGGALSSSATVKAAIKCVFKSWRQKKKSLGLACAGQDRPIVIPYDSLITLAFYGHPKDNDTFYKTIKEKKKKLRDLSQDSADTWADEFRDKFVRLVDVTRQIKHYLYQGQGNTVFKVGENDEGMGACLIVFGEWRGAILDAESEAAQEEVREATHIVHLMETDGIVEMEDKPYMRKSSMVLETPEALSRRQSGVCRRESTSVVEMSALDNPPNENIVRPQI